MRLPVPPPRHFVFSVVYVDRFSFAAALALCNGFRLHRIQVAATTFRVRSGGHLHLQHGFPCASGNVSLSERFDKSLVFTNWHPPRLQCVDNGVSKQQSDRYNDRPPDMEWNARDPNACVCGFCGDGLGGVRVGNRQTTPGDTADASANILRIQSDRWHDGRRPPVTLGRVISD